LILTQKKTANLDIAAVVPKSAGRSRYTHKKYPYPENQDFNFLVFRDILILHRWKFKTPVFTNTLNPPLGLPFR